MENNINAGKKQEITGHVMACFTQLMWGSTFVSSKVLLSYFSPLEVFFLRAVMAYLVLWLCYPHFLRVRERKREWCFAGAALTGLVLYYVLENTALTMTYASNVGIIVACAPFFVAVIVGILFKSEKLHWKFFLGFLISMIGIVIISLNGQKNMGLNPSGDLLAVLAMVCWGFYSAIVKIISGWDYPVIAVTRRIYFYAVVIMIPLCIYQGSYWEPEYLMKPMVIGNFLFLGIGGSAVGFLLWNLSTKLIGAIKTSIYIYLSPVTTLILSVMILGERLTVISLIGIILIFAGLILAQNISLGRKEKENENI